jgi:hypothetical protein
VRGLRLVRSGCTQRVAIFSVIVSPCEYPQFRSHYWHDRRAVRVHPGRIDSRPLNWGHDISAPSGYHPPEEDPLPTGRPDLASAEHKRQAWTQGLLECTAKTASADARAAEVVVQCWRVRAGVGARGARRPGRGVRRGLRSRRHLGRTVRAGGGIRGHGVVPRRCPGRPVPDHRPLQDEQGWRSFRNAFSSAYESLDAQLEGLAATERSLFEGSS